MQSKPGKYFLERRKTFLLKFFWRQSVMSNRKLIRTTLADVKARREEGIQRERINGHGQRPGGIPQNRLAEHAGGIQVRKRQPPPTETHAELYYYKKQIDDHRPTILGLQDGGDIEGKIER